jgi:hypothetical protein
MRLPCTPGPARTPRPRPPGRPRVAAGRQELTREGAREAEARGHRTAGTGGPGGRTSVRPRRRGARPPVPAGGASVHLHPSRSISSADQISGCQQHKVISKIMNPIQGDTGVSEAHAPSNRNHVGRVRRIGRGTGSKCGPIQRRVALPRSSSGI